MSERTQRFLADALGLTAHERAELASALLASLEPAAGEDDAESVDAAWATEVERRLARYLEGNARSLPWAQVRAEAERRLRDR